MTIIETTCSIVGRFADERVAESARILIEHLSERAIRPRIALGSELALPPDLQIERVPESQLADGAKLMVAIGGDGTLLYAARLVADKDVPLIGINRGRLGFLTDVLPQDMIASVDAALAGKSEVDERPLLEARLLRPGRGESRILALNDVVVQKVETGRMLDFETWIDGVYVNNHGGDGLVVASATGSTAYALSCGGPIISPHLDVLVVAPICPHTLSDRPIVISANSVVTVTLIERFEARAQVTCDGVVAGDFLPGDRLEIHRSRRKIRLLHPAGFEYYRLLRSKLHWGRGAYDTIE
ncbi:MAG: NAD(+)/NADH kinase [Pseudomonadales bacterium]|nr:NAD(+)/NADH kinase [Pseudomonadales bacterium]